MYKVIVPMGYMGSGSSAITDLIHEFEGYEARNNSFEYVFLHCPDGVFDLEDKLLVGNNAIRSDEALHSFYNRMKELYYDKLWWPANYKKRLHPEFLKYTEMYIEKLTQYKSGNAWYMQQKPTLITFIKNCIRRLILIISARKIRLPYSLRYSPMLLSFVNDEEFYSASKEYINQIFDLMGIREENIIADQLLLPHNLWRMEKYFGENIECFVIQRDPRDVFIINKYIWGKSDNAVPYPVDVEEFCRYYRHLRESEKEADNIHIHRFWFEDLVYQYEESVERISNILKVDRKLHKQKRVYFNPEKSINNTQFFTIEKYKEEVKVIERELPEYLYQFPYVRKPEINQSF